MLSAQPQDRGLVLEIAGAAVPAIMGVAATRERSVEADNTGGPTLLEPGDELFAAPDAQPAEIEDAEFCAAPLAQARDALQRIDIVVEGRSDKDPDLKIALRCLLPIVEPMHQLFEPSKRQRAALARFRDQAVATDMGAGRMPQRKPQSLPNDLPRHSYLLPD
jgi:hypothetical protein